MAIHDWTRVNAGIFHAFHTRWITGICDALNSGILGPDFYALPEQIAGGVGPDVLTLKAPNRDRKPNADTGGVQVLEAPPKVLTRVRAEINQYADKAKAAVVRHISEHDVIAVIEILSPGNKSSERDTDAFIKKASNLLAGCVHLLLIDLLPAGPRDPQGLHSLILQYLDPNAVVADLPEDRPLCLSSFRADLTFAEAFVEPTAVGLELVDMPLFLGPDAYIPAPLAATYRDAFAALPAYWRGVIEGATP